MKLLTGLSTRRAAAPAACSSAQEWPKLWNLRHVEIEIPTMHLDFLNAFSVHLSRVKTAITDMQRLRQTVDVKSQSAPGADVNTINSGLLQVVYHCCCRWIRCSWEQHCRNACFFASLCIWTSYSLLTAVVVEANVLIAKYTTAERKSFICLTGER